MTPDEVGTRWNEVEKPAGGAMGAKAADAKVFSSRRAQKAEPAQHQGGAMGRKVFDKRRIDVKTSDEYRQEREHRTAGGQAALQERRVRQDLKRDVNAAFGGNAEAVRDWKTVAEIAIGLAQEEDDESRAALNHLMWNYEDQLRTHTDTLVGEDFWDQNKQEAPEPGRIQKILGEVGDFFTWAESGGESARRAIGAAMLALRDDDTVGLSDGELWREAGRQGARAVDFTRLLPGYGGVTKGIDLNAQDGDASPGRIYGEGGTHIDLDLDGDGRLSFMEALNRTTKSDDKEKDTGKFWGGDALANIAGVVGEAVFDPVSHLGAGTPALARNGSRAFITQATREGWGDAAGEIMQRAATRGLRKLPTAERELVEATLKRAAADLPKVRKMGIPGQSRNIPERQIRAMEQGLQSGVKIGGTTVLPSHTIARGALRKATGKGFKGRKVYEVIGNDTVDDLRRLDEAVQDGAPVEDLVRTVLYRGYEQGWADQLINIPGLGRVIKGMKPRAMTRALHGEEAASAVGRVLARSRAATDSVPELNNSLLEIKVGSTLAGALEESGDWEALARHINEQFGQKTGQQALELGDLGPKAAALIEELEEVKAATRVSLIGARANAQDLAAMDTWFADVTTKALKDGIEGNSALSGQVTGQARKSTLRELSSLPEDSVRELAFDSEEALRSAVGEGADDFVKYSAGGQDFFVERNVLEDIKELDSVLGSPAQKGKVAQAFDQMNNVWGAMATALAPNPAFIARNAGGNFFLMALGGFSTPMNLVRAGSVMRPHQKIVRLAAKEGVSMRQALDLFEGAIDDDTFRLLAGAYDEGVLGNMGRQLDVVQENAGQLNSSTNTLTKVTDKAQDPNGLWYKATFGPSQAVEDHARLSLYLDQLAKGADEDGAAGHVAKYLFDYGDTTNVERNVIRRASRFYTFLRKNTALQAEMIGREPGRMLALQGMVDDGEEAMVRDPDGNIETPPWLPNGAGGLMGGLAVGVNLETPLDAALDAAQPLTVLGHELANYGDPGAAIEDRIAGRETGTGALVDSLVGLTSGFGPAVATFVQESQTGRDSFTGRRLDPEGNLRDRGWFRFIDTLSPVAGRVERTARTIDEKGRYDAQAKVLKLLAGVQIYGTDSPEGAEAREAETVYRELDAIRDELVSKGADIPTINELREDGIYGQRDRLREALAYSWSKNDDGTVEWDEQVKDDRILSIVPKVLREHFGLPEPEGAGLSRGPIPEAEEGSELWAEQVNRDTADIQEALSLWLGRELSDQDALDILIMMPGGPSNEELEEMGIEPASTSNRFLPKEEQPEKVDRLDTYARALGLDPAALSAMRPRMSRIEQVIAEATEAGVPRDQLLKYITTSKDEGGGGTLSRKDRALFNQLYNTAPGSGIIDLTLTRMPEFTDEDAERAWEKAWESEMELRLTAQLYGLPTPTAEQIRDYVLNSQLSAAEIKITGDTKLDSAPSRKDLRSDEEKARQAFAERQASLSGVGSQGQGNPFTGRATS